MAHTFTPSAESLAIFDEIKSEIDVERAGALASLRAVKKVNNHCTEDEVEPVSKLSASSWWNGLSPVHVLHASSDSEVQSSTVESKVPDAAHPASPSTPSAKAVHAFEDVKTVSWSWFMTTPPQGSTKIMDEEEHPHNKPSDKARESGGRMLEKGLATSDGNFAPSGKFKKNVDANLPALPSPSTSLRLGDDRIPGKAIPETSLRTMRQSEHSFDHSSVLSFAKEAGQRRKSKCSPGGRAVTGFKAIGMGTVHSEYGTSTAADNILFPATHETRGQVKPFGPLTEKEMAAKIWSEQVTEYQRKLRGNAPIGWELWDRSHIPYQLRASRPSPVSGASCGWELNEELVRIVRARMSRATPKQDCSSNGFLTWVSNGVSAVLSLVGSGLGALSRMMSGAAVRGLKNARKCVWSVAILLRVV